MLRAFNGHVMLLYYTNCSHSMCYQERLWFKKLTKHWVRACMSPLKEQFVNGHDKNNVVFGVFFKQFLI